MQKKKSGAKEEISIHRICLQSFQFHESFILIYIGRTFYFCKIQMMNSLHLSKHLE